MGVEIERKYLVEGHAWKSESITVLPIRQGYLARKPRRSVRVRVSGERAFLTIKGKTVGFTCPEYEYEIPVADANELLDNVVALPIIQKMRHIVNYRGHVWEVDVFLGDNEGLIVAEIELNDEEETFVSPPWLGSEVTNDSRYKNVNLVRLPYKEWDHV